MYFDVLVERYGKQGETKLKRKQREKTKSKIYRKRMIYAKWNLKIKQKQNNEKLKLTRNKCNLFQNLIINQ